MPMLLTGAAPPGLTSHVHSARANPAILRAPTVTGSATDSGRSPRGRLR